jgi:diguanylate cyclase (GGDEF)-like protein/PAS domain S-box-containing protein
MRFQVSPFSIAFLAAALIGATGTLTAWHRRRAHGGLSLSLMLMAVTLWNLAGFMEVSVIGLPDKIVWSKVMYLGAHLAPVFFLLFTFQFTNVQRRLIPRDIFLLFLLPVLTILLAATNEWHHLIWRDFSPGPPGSNLYIYHHGIWFWIETLYISGILLVGTVILFRFAMRSREIFRYQGAALILGALFPWAGFILYILPINPFPGLDLTAISFTFCGAILVFSLLRLHFLELIPVAREYLIENMVDGLLVLDQKNRIIDINPAARRLLGFNNRFLIGQYAEALLANWPIFTHSLSSSGGVESAMTLHLPGITYHIDLRVSPLYGQNGELTGRLIVLRDRTSGKHTEEALRKANRELQYKLVEIEKLQDKLVEQALRDPLTGVYNRRYLDATFERELSGAKRKDYPIMIMMMDIDHFKTINDTYGHKAGDQVLITLADLLLSMFRQNDIVCRYGGDEFLVIMPESSLEGAQYRAEILRQDFAALSIQYGDMILHATISIGIAGYPQHGDTLDAIIQSADVAIYAAKEAGRNQVQVGKMGTIEQSK